MVARHPRGFVAAMLVVALMFWTGMGATALLAHQVFDGIPDRSTLSRVTQMARASVFFDRHGQPAFTISKEQRFEVPLDRISPNLRNAIIAIEDQRFYSTAASISFVSAAPRWPTSARGAAHRAPARSRSSSRA